MQFKDNLPDGRQEVELRQWAHQTVHFNLDSHVINQGNFVHFLLQ